MFNTEIEKKIIDFIKKSPIGASSSEISRYLNINRITLTKYLDVIKEKALIDFKPFGMAKLWYIPVKLNRDEFLNDVLTELAASLDKEKSKEVINNIGKKIAHDIEKMYKEFYNVDKLNIDQLAEAIEDIGKKIGGEFRVVEKNRELLIIKIVKSPFGEKEKRNPELAKIFSNILGVFAAKNFEYSKVSMKKAIPDKVQDYNIFLYLKKTPHSEKEKTDGYVSVDEKA